METVARPEVGTLDWVVPPLLSRSVKFWPLMPHKVSCTVAGVVKLA